MNKRKIRILFSLFVFIASSLTVFLTGIPPKNVPPLDSISSTNVPDQVWVKRDGEEVLQAENQTQEDLDKNNQTEVREDLVDNGENIEGYKVVKVVDGDTFDVEIDGKIERLRLIGIDTPETVDPRKAVGCFGIEASNKAKELLSGQHVILESDPMQGERDRYGRLLRYAFLSDGTNFGLIMISQGFAHEYTYRFPYKYQTQFKQAELDARQNNIGLWSPDSCLGNK